MSAPTDKRKTEIAVIQLLPNMLTIVAICAGLTAIRFGVQGNYVLAVKLILAACVLDGLDGRLARFLGSDSQMGAELDSLADFLNFGVAPPLLLYFWALEDNASAAWIAVLFYAVCCVVRLARFNVSSKLDTEGETGAYFIGVPSPAGALLVMLPMFVSFAFANAPLLPDYLICLHMILIGLLLISPIRISSFKSARIPREKVKYLLVGLAFVGAAVMTYAWITLLVLCLIYIIAVTWAWLTRKSDPKQKG